MNMQCRLGVGAKIAPEDLDMFGLRRKTTAASNDALLEQIMGRKAAKGHKASKARPDDRSRVGQETQAKGGRVIATTQDSGDEEEGRAAMFKSKTSAKGKRRVQKAAESGEDARSDSEEEERRGPKRKTTVGGSYLDQLLADKAHKKKKTKT